jgi:outer membrane protein W
VPRVHTKIDLVPIGFGLRYLCPICDDFIAYASVGGQYTHLHIKDKSQFLIKNVNKWECGGLVKLGMLYDFCDGFFVDVFGQYSYLQMDFRKRENSNDDLVYRHNADLSGWTVGAGIGYRFNFF